VAVNGRGLGALAATPIAFGNSCVRVVGCDERVTYQRSSRPRVGLHCSNV